MTLLSKALSGKRVLPVSAFGGTLAQPPKATMEQFLRAYGEIGWFHAVVSFIARGIAETEWNLYRETDGEKEEISGPHRIKTLLENPNPFQSGHDIRELTQVYEDVTGEGYWHLDVNEGKDELWTFSPTRIKVVISNKEYITGYVFASAEGDIPLPKEDIIPFITPNPLTPWRGLSPAQAIGIELDTQTYANQTNRFYFYNGATMGLVISYPSDVSTEEYARLKEQFNADHRGYGRAHRVTILSGGGGTPTISQAGQSFGTRDMDFVNMLKNGRDAILGGYGLPYSQLGGAEVNTRATAEAAQVDVARRVLRPRLVKKRETLNRLLVPKFVSKETPKNAYGLQRSLCKNYGYWTADADKRVYEIKSRLNIEGNLTDNPTNMEKVWKALGESTSLMLDFNNPVPKDVIQNSTIAGQLYRQGVATKNEAREMVELDPVDDGDEFYTAPAPASLFGGFGSPSGDESTQEDKETETEEDANDSKSKSVKKKPLFPDEASREAHWEKWVKQAESFEAKFIPAVQMVFDKTKQEALKNCKQGINRDSKLIDRNRFIDRYTEAVTPVLTECMIAAVRNGMALVEQTNPHKEISLPRLLNDFALNWLHTRIKWAAEQIGDETENLLRNVLIEGFEHGVGIPAIASRIREIPGFADKSRAERVARTEIMSAHAQGTLEGYKDSGIVKQVQFWAAADERSCDYCMEYHEHTFNLGEEMPIPLHPNCRCGWLAVIGD